MARYVTLIQSPWKPEVAFAYMADLRNFVQWDPGVRRVSQLSGSAGGAGAVFEVVVAGIGRGLPLRYTTTVYEEPERLTITATTRRLTSIDTISVAADQPNGSVVSYEAQLLLNGPLHVFDVLLKPFFDRIAERAASGLRLVLGR